LPRFSVIVPAYQVQAYLHACLESVLSQSYPDLEPIAVDEFAARDPRVRPVHLARNQGLGPARNAGMAEATGDCLVFLDGDDTLTPGALHAIADRLKETGEPDVLVHDYARTHWTGETVRNEAAAQLTEQGPAPFLHFDSFEQCERVVAYVDQNPELAQWRPALFRHVIDHLLVVFSRPDRLPRGSRAEFLRKARAHYRRYRTAGAPGGLRACLRHTLVRLGLHRTFRALRLAAALLRRVHKATHRLLTTLRSTALRLHYRVQRRLPLRADRAVFAAYGGRGHGCHPGALEQAVRTHAPHIRTAWVARPEHHHTIPSGAHRMRPDTAAYWTALARSKYLFDNADFDQLLRGVDQWDHVLPAHRHATLTWERVHPGDCRTLEYGSPRNDVFQQATSADPTRLRESLGIPKGTVAILYAPTHRDYRRTQQPTLNLDRILRRLGPRFVVLARAHHRHGGPLAPTSGRVVDITDHPSVEQLCLASRSADELIDIFATGHWRGSRAAELRSAFRERFCPYDDGRARRGGERPAAGHPARRAPPRAVGGRASRALPARHHSATRGSVGRHRPPLNIGLTPGSSHAVQPVPAHTQPAVHLASGRAARTP
jgi:glycosyltransferase involved in cell wall biosynthesis